MRRPGGIVKQLSCWVEEEYLDFRASIRLLTSCGNFNSPPSSPPSPGGAAPSRSCSAHIRWTRSYTGDYCFCTLRRCAPHMRGVSAPHRHDPRGRSPAEPCRALRRFDRPLGAALGLRAAGSRPLGNRASSLSRRGFNATQYACAISASMLYLSRGRRPWGVCGAMGRGWGPHGPLRDPELVQTSTIDKLEAGTVQFLTDTV